MLTVKQDSHQKVTSVEYDPYDQLHCIAPFDASYPSPDDEAAEAEVTISGGAQACCGAMHTPAHPCSAPLQRPA